MYLEKWVSELRLEILMAHYGFDLSTSYNFWTGYVLYLIPMEWNLIHLVTK